MATGLKKDSRVIYLYGITQEKPRDIPDMIGVDRFAKIQTIDCEGVVCWISRVSALDFDKSLANNMENLDWVAETSVAHQRVIATIGSKAEILPARLGTIFLTEASLCKHVLKRLESLKRDFKRIKGADEWGVKVFEVQPLVVPKIRSGKDYLKAKAALLPARGKKLDSAAEIAEFEHALQGVASDTAPAGSVSRGQRGLAFQRTLLVRRANRRKLESLLQKFARDWADARRIECTGPWPPYSFVSRPDDGVRLK
ncbi:MAG TPA: GvpL/GvpF family gas vesicle protein [Terriglobales bacterium]|nr:GvpL/GvpF family gas vesicle protein [Terriglobales bacterium]